MLTFTALRYANVQRQQEWDPDGLIEKPFAGLELAGEQGELIERLLLALDFSRAIGKLCNTVKKLEREKLGLPGSKATFSQMAEEFADCQICLDLLAMHCCVDLGEATIMKFNLTSDKLRLQTRLESKGNINVF